MGMTTMMAVNVNTQCAPDVRITRTYSLFGGVSCTYQERVTGRTSITIPAATPSGTGCTAPAL